MSLPILSGRAEWGSVLLARLAEHEAGSVPADAPWSSFRAVSSSLSGDGLIRMVSESGLRGGGGAGYPAGRKWRAVAAQPERDRYVVVNGFEADPGSQVDRSLMELDPAAVVEGAALAAWAVGAEEAVIVVRASAATAAGRLRAAIAAAESRGDLGIDAGDSGRTIMVTLRELSGSFVAGEETVLLRALESRRAQPDQRPPYPAERGLWGKPTLVHNVKTIAALPWIAARGGAAYASIGRPGTPGTTLVQLGGTVQRAGIAEVPWGTPLRDVIEGPGGGAKGALKAVLVGGPSGGFLPPDALDTPLDHGSLEAAGAICGSGALVTLDDGACVVELATLMTRFLSDEACGKTIPCRIGTRRLAELGAGFCSGRCRPTDVALAHDLAADVRDAALCGLEATAVNPLLSGMRYFAEEFEDHIVRGSCAAGVCQPIRVAAAAAARPAATGTP
jgi:NADH:ubiquinone oxidoreductase subunit F (NADH-binding)